jgi:hypothetical protein
MHNQAAKRTPQLLADSVRLFRLGSLRRFIQALRSCQAAADDTVDSGDFAVMQRVSDSSATSTWL